MNRDKIEGIRAAPMLGNGTALNGPSRLTGYKKRLTKRLRESSDTSYPATSRIPGSATHWR